MKLLTALFILSSGYGLSQINLGLISEYTFNSANANDEVGTNDGVVNGAILTNDRFGNPNAAYLFDGNDYIDFGDPSDFQFGYSNFSFSIWFRKDTIQFSSLFGKIDGFDGYFCGFGDSLGINLVAGHFLNVGGSEDGTARIYAKYLPDNSWHHLVFVQDYATANYYYLDNQLITTDNTPFPNSTGFDVAGNNLVLGKHSGLPLYFKGAADDIRIYDRALTATDVDLLFNDQPALSLAEQELHDLRLFPNPSSGIVTIEMNETMQKIRVLTSEGKEIACFKPNSDSYTFNNEFLSPGMYLVEISGVQFKSTKRLLVN